MSRLLRYEPTTQRAPGWWDRFLKVVNREPELEAYQLAERFGLTERQAANAKSYAVRVARGLR